MRKSTVSLCLLTLLVFLGSAGESFALPACQGNDESKGQNCEDTLTSGSGKVFLGEFKDGKFIGTHARTGNKYVGKWRNDKKHVQGTFTFPNGEKHVGGWKNDLPNGLGIHTYSDGTVEAGMFENSNFLYAKKATPPVPEKKPTVTENPNKLVTAASGSGFAVSSSGHAITNNHVTHGCTNVKINHDGNTTKARVVAHDSHNDLALLKGDFKPSTVLPLSRDNPQLPQEIYVAGFPFGQKISSFIKVTKGIVSSLAGLDNNVSNIQIDAALQPGNSGGPIIDENGNVVAVAVARLDLMTVVENWGVVPENTNFGIKPTVVLNLLQSNNIKLRAPNTKSVSKTTLGKTISDATYYLSCWITMAQIEKLRTEKVMFRSIE